MILYTAPMEMDVEMMKENPEQMERGMEPLNAWDQKNGLCLVDLGAPLAKGIHIDEAVKGLIDEYLLIVHPWFWARENFCSKTWTQGRS